MMFISRYSETMKQWVPLVILFSVAVLMHAPFYHGHWMVHGMMPLLHLAVLYYYCITNPQRMPLWGVFCAGIIYDALSGTPLGITSIINMALVLMLLPQRRFFLKKPYVVLLAGFAFLLLLVLVIEYGLLLTVFGRASNITGIAFQWGLTVACYSPLHMLLNKITMIVKGHMPYGH